MMTGRQIWERFGKYWQREIDTDDKICNKKL